MHNADGSALGEVSASSMKTTLAMEMVGDADELPLNEHSAGQQPVVKLHRRRVVVDSH